MRLLHLDIELYFADRFRPYSISQQLYKALTGRQPTVIEEIAEPEVVIRSIKRKQLVAWDSNSCRVVMESVTNPEECFGQMVALLHTIDRVASIGELARKQLTTYWLLPTESHSFKSLERKYRDTLIAQQPIWKNVSDSSVITDIKINDLTLHHQSGPMRIGQLRSEYTEFKLDDIPRVFLFLWASIHSYEVVKYSTEDIRRFLFASFEHCKHHSKLFEGIWREVL